MNATQTEEEIFFHAMELTSWEERKTYLHEVCAGNADLRMRVEALLRRHEESDGVLDSPPPGFSGTIESLPPTEQPGTIIGSYKLLQQIGEGGMGVVFMAEQTWPIQRTIALKIIKLGMDTRQVIARFEAERQALAIMDHPNIAKVVDAGTTKNGRPYFAMELVKGVPIIAYCDQEQLSIHQRLELVIAVCQAVEHAHQKGIIHRDLKPSNVLVAEYDGKPVPKIIDFGVAKATAQRLTEKTMFTQYGQLIGTFEYMSPEQARFNQLDVDTRTDIYALGVLLYELLTGSTPFEKRRRELAGFDEILRIICEEEPPPPSTRLSSNGVLPAIAARRSAEPARLERLVRGELDWIVMKALEKDRSRRYQTAGALAHDLRHYLNDEPVGACPPSTTYRLQKFARRNRAALMTAALVATALIVGSVFSVSQAVRATNAELLAQARFKDMEASANKARQAVDDMYTQVAEKWLAHQPQMEPVQRAFLEKALRFYTEFAKETSNDPSIRFETARAYRRIAEIQHRLGQPSQAEEAFRQAIDQTQALRDEFPTNSAYRAELTDTLHKFGVLLGDTGRYQEEETIHRRALALDEQLAADFPTNLEYRRDLGRGHWYVAQVFAAMHQRDVAVQNYRKAIGIQKRLVAEFPSSPEYREHLAESLFGLGTSVRVLGATQEYEQALDDAADLFEQLTAEFPSLPGYRNQLANVYYWRMKGPAGRGRPESYPKAAEQYLRRALALQHKLADDFPAVADYRYDLFRSYKTLGWVLSRDSRHEEAEAALRQAAGIAETLVADSPSVHYYRGTLAQAYAFLAQILMETDRLPEAEDAYRKSISLLERLVAEFPEVPTYEPDLRQAYCHLGSVLKLTDRPLEAAAAYHKALELNPQDAMALRGLSELQQPATATTNH